MNFSVYTRITETTKVSVELLDNEAGKFAAVYAGGLTVNEGGLTVMVNSREKLLEIASMLENTAQKWAEEDEN